MIEARIQTNGAVAVAKEQTASPANALSFHAALELLKKLKTLRRSWAEMGNELQRQCGVQLDKEQLKALVR
jgi:hypothetical protein